MDGGVLAGISFCLGLRLRMGRDLVRDTNDGHVSYSSSTTTVCRGERREAGALVWLFVDVLGTRQSRPAAPAHAGFYNE